MKDTEKQTDVSVNGNMDGNMIVGDGNKIIVSTNSGVDKAASEMAILRLEKEIESIKNADNEIIKIKGKYYLPESISFFQHGIAYVLVTEYKRKPSDLLKMWNGTGFKDKEMNAVLAKLTINEMKVVKDFFSKFFDNDIEPPSYDMKSMVNKILEDLDRLIELEESKTLLSRKLEELQKHKKIVQAI